MFADIDGYIAEKELPVLEECNVWPGFDFKTEQAGDHQKLRAMMKPIALEKCPQDLEGSGRSQEIFLP